MWGETACVARHGYWQLYLMPFISQSVWQVKVYLFISCQKVHWLRNVATLDVDGQHSCWRYKKTTTKDKLQYACKPLWISAGIEYHALTQLHTLVESFQTVHKAKNSLKQLEKKKQKHRREKSVCRERQEIRQYTDSRGMGRYKCRMFTYAISARKIKYIFIINIYTLPTR